MKLAAIGLAIAIAAHAATPAITDPEAFVRGVYQKIAAHANDTSYDPPDDIYTARLAGLFKADRKKHPDGVGCIDFDFWTNSQDPSGIKDIRVRSGDQGDPARKTVIATFTLERPLEIHLEFQRVGGRWLLDDVSSVKSEQWVLSKVLQCK